MIGVELRELIGGRVIAVGDDFSPFIIVEKGQKLFIVRPIECEEVTGFVVEEVGENG